MQINKTDFKVILNHMKSLSQLENNNLINQTRNGKTDYNDINQLINIYSSKKISKLMDKINNNFLTLGGGDTDDDDDDQEDEDNQDKDDKDKDDKEEDKEEDKITKTKLELIKIITSLEKYIKQLQEQEQEQQQTQPKKTTKTTKKQQLMKIFNKRKKNN
jgi:ribosomal protein L12E/L44/L45/RPP1/RPP2